MDKNIIEKKLLNISQKMNFTATLGRTLYKMYHSNNKPADIDGLILILNIYIKITRKKIANLEYYIMKQN